MGKLIQEIQLDRFDFPLNPSEQSAYRTKTTIKRAIDITSALVGLVLFAPFMLITVILIKLTSPGPVLYVRENLGFRTQPFMMLKFRTMRVGADEMEMSFHERGEGNFFKVKDDPRLSPVGGFLRRFSIDELPQLINVLKGEMSLVGPRPIFDFELDAFNHKDQLRRFSMKPGLTGLWQINGRSATTDAKRIQYDTEYVANWSLWLDLKILLKTVPAVIKGKGAW